MSNLTLLMKTSIVNEMGLNKLKNAQKNEKIKMLVLSTLIIVSMIVLAVYGFTLCFYLSDFLMKNNQMELLLVMGIIGSVTSTMFVAIYKAPSYLFQSRDYEMLASLPIKKSTILSSKILSLILNNFLISITFVLIPTIVYFIKMDTGVLYIPYLIILVLALPLIPTIISSIIAFFISNISSRMKNNNITMIILNILLVVGVMVLSFNLQNIAIKFLQNSSSIIEATQKIYPLTYYFVDALKNNNFISLSILVLASIIPTGIFVYIFSNNFGKINSKMNESYKTNNYELKELKSSKPVFALLKKESKRFISSTVYVINSSIGVILMPLFAISIILISYDKIATILEMNVMENMIKAQMMGIAVFCIIMTNTAAVSISLEGKNLWILKSSPIDEIDIFKSKIYLNSILIIPVIVLSFLGIGIKLNFGIQTILLFTISIIILGFFSPALGLFINLLYPKLEFTSDVSVVKQSASVLLTMIASIVSIAIVCAVLYFVGIRSINLFLIFANVIFLILGTILWKTIKTKGVILFRNL
ncbi:putative ABC transporter permease subunit [Romboutsia sp.]|uniref:putative ABC transporter permease subunit n=1 Tax=Romboutsia sp. TaxID=1965302 RepID=UPI003F375629